MDKSVLTQEQIDELLSGGSKNIKQSGKNDGVSSEIQNRIFASSKQNYYDFKRPDIITGFQRQEFMELFSEILRPFVRDFSSEIERKIKLDVTCVDTVTNREFIDCMEGPSFMQHYSTDSGDIIFECDRNMGFKILNQKPEEIISRTQMLSFKNFFSDKFTEKFLEDVGTKMQRKVSLLKSRCIADSKDYTTLGLKRDEQSLLFTIEVSEGEENGIINFLLSKNFFDSIKAAGVFKNSGLTPAMEKTNFRIELNRSKMPDEKIETGKKIVLCHNVLEELNFVMDDKIYAKCELMVIKDYFAVKITKTFKEPVDIPSEDYLTVSLGETYVGEREFNNLLEGDLFILDTFAGNPSDIICSGHILGKGELSVDGNYIAVEYLPEKNIKIENSFENIFDFVNSYDPKLVCEVLERLGTHFAAVVMACADETNAADLIQMFLKEKQIELLEMINEGILLYDSIVRNYADLLKRKLDGELISKNNFKGGRERVIEILKVVGETKLKDLLSELKRTDKKLHDEFRSRLFFFEEITILDDRSIQKIMRELDTYELAKALKKTSKKVADKFFRNISKSCMNELKEDMDYMGPVRLGDVEEAQCKIVNVILQKEASGEIVIPRTKMDVLL
ncbi:FliG C-terminal domain-containing protein [Treponema sp.]|uniref:FliG C-terminal domain-containing protein n=1 Tax=Treponema sp. TaxID=166 RepID=UPI00298E9EE7|nr:FliG C-terminal domain-containing protein [Treponema sp.]MCQ2241251.1 hypothetical protein [Treponema sp.]